MAMGHDFANEKLRDVLIDTETNDDSYSMDSYVTSSETSLEKPTTFGTSSVINSLSEFIESMNIQSNIQTDSEGNNESDGDNFIIYDNDKYIDLVNTNETQSDKENFYDSSNEEGVRYHGPRTDKGAPCLETTSSANLDLFASPWIFFDGESVSSDIGASIRDLVTCLDNSFIGNKEQCVQNVLFLGNLRDGGKKNHPAYMISLVWFWEFHPKTFLAAIAPNILENSCARDLLTLLCVITFNKSYNIDRLWLGEQPDAAFDTKRVTIKQQEKDIWSGLLGKFGLKSKDVVRQEELYAPRPKKKSKPYNTTQSDEPKSPPMLNLSPPSLLVRDVIRSSDTSPFPTTPDNITSGEEMLNSGRAQEHTWGARKRTRVKSGKKNIWLNEKFKIAYQEQKKKLHTRDHVSMSGIKSDVNDYQQLVDFVVDFFVNGLANKHKMIGKWAPSVNASHDKATRGVKAFGLPESWNGGIAQAVAWKLFGHLIKKHENDGIEGVVFPTAKAKQFVMTRYKKLLSELRVD